MSGKNSAKIQNSTSSICSRASLKIIHLILLLNWIIIEMERFNVSFFNHSQNSNTLSITFNSSFFSSSRENVCIMIIMNMYYFGPLQSFIFKYIYFFLLLKCYAFTFLLEFMDFHLVQFFCCSRGHSFSASKSIKHNVLNWIL